jgi:hypothetical protein
LAGALDNKTRAIAEKLLKKFGKVATYSKIISGVYDHYTQMVVNTKTDYPVTIYIDKPDISLINGGLATASDLLILISAKELGRSIEANDIVSFDSKSYTVLRDMPIYSGEEIALYRVICKAS